VQFAHVVPLADQAAVISGGGGSPFPPFTFSMPFSPFEWIELRAMWFCSPAGPSPAFPITRTPSPPLCAITLGLSAPVPPITLMKALSMSTPSSPLPSAVPVTPTPM
jgi:hypothetical protein